MTLPFLLGQFPYLKAIDDGRFRCLVWEPDSGHYVVATNLGGMDYPDLNDFMVCVYRDEQSFGDDPGTSLLDSFTSENCDDLWVAFDAAEHCVEVQP